MSACAGVDTRFDRSELEREDAGLVLGEFPLEQGAIVDGDTIKVDGLDASLRLLAIDTEETFKSDKAWRRFEVGWSAYLEHEQAKTSRPVKIPTPLGMEAKHWAEDFFAGVTRVRLERDHPNKIRGAYNRFLAYVFVERDGEWVNYNVEAVRAGMSPYFMKYGYSTRFHADFVAAEAEARAAGRGIWADDARCYPDYQLREQWWNARAEFVAAFEREAQDEPEFIDLSHWDAMLRLEDALGQEVEILSTVGGIRQGDRGPKRVLLSRRLFQDFPVIFWEDEIFDASGIERYTGEYVRVRGVVSSYTDRRSGRRQLQIQVRDPLQITLPSYDPPGKPEDIDLDQDFWLDEDEPALEREEPSTPREPAETPAPEPAPQTTPAPTDDAPATPSTAAPTTPPPGAT